MGPLPDKTTTTPEQAQTPALRVVSGGRITITLDAPIQAHGDEITTLTFRPLKVEDLNRGGYPVRLGADGTMEPIPDRISVLISRLAGIPDSSVRELTVADWHRAMEVVVGFFGPSTRNS